MQENSRIEIEGKQVRLRDWTLDDLPLFEHWQRPGNRWQKFDGPYYQSSTDESKVLTEKLKEKIEQSEFPSPRLRLVIADRKTDRLLGTVSSYWESIETNWLCIGITIYDPEYWGKGIGFQALGLWIDYLFEVRPEIVRLDMRTWSGNEGLIRLAKKLHFTQEACFRMARLVDGKYFDGLGYGILRTEWEMKYPIGF